MKRFYILIPLYCLFHEQQDVSLPPTQQLYYIL